MAFADPQSVTINAVAQTLPRTGQGIRSGEFTKDDGNVKLEVAHSVGRNARERSQIKLTHRKIAADPLINDRSIQYSMSVYLVVDRPATGYTLTEAKQIGDALTAYLTASSGARLTQLLGREI